MTILKTLIVTCALLFSASTSIANDESTGTGTVAETMTSGGYVYMRLEEDGAWVASSPIPVAVGDKITYSGGMTMKDFASRTLKRNFEYIIFAGKLEVVSEFDADAHAIAAASDQNEFAKSDTAPEPQAGDPQQFADD